MSLYGLDIIESRDGRRYLLEVNGIKSGMHGFEQIYGDDRVERKVFDMLEERYGKLTVNDGTFSRKKFKKKHPVRFALNKVLDNVLSKAPFFGNMVFPLPPALLSDKAEIDWLKEKPSKGGIIDIKRFEKYTGQHSTVINILNQRLPQPLVNNFVAEEIAGNKLLQYLLLEDSAISDSIVPSSFVGMGITNEAELEKLISTYENFVIKPIIGCQGRGVKFLTGKEVGEKYRNSSGPFDDSLKFIFSPSDLSVKKRFSSLEEMIHAGNFTFEWGTSIIQPFVDSRKNKDEEMYSSARAIVCNNKFVDAYKRVSKNPKVNFSQDAKAIPFDYDSKFADFCENAVDVFEKKAVEQNPDSFKKIIYENYMNGMGRYFDKFQTTFEGKLGSVIFEVMTIVAQYSDKK